MASALVQMNLFSPCSQLSDMIMIASEASLESFPSSREEGHKRSQSDGDEDQERSHVKKRRKQSKPIRITAIDSDSPTKKSNGSGSQENDAMNFSETGEHFLTERLDLMDSSTFSTAKTYNYIQENHKNINDNQGKGVQLETTYGSVVPLNLSNIKSSYVDSLVVPSISENQFTNTNTSVDDSLPQFRSNDSPKTPTAQEGSYLSSHSPTLLLPIFKPNQIQNHMSHISPQMRIFNPEAYCDLCNKEFCNKYFLKTHKANKHGIYSETSGGTTLLDPGSTLPFTNYFSTNNESYESPPSFQTTSSAKSLTLYNQNSYSSNRGPPKKSQILQQPQTSLFSLKSNSSGNMRALCNICQREFCNKYFVRRHKLKIHGIVDPISKDGTGIDFQENNTINNNSSQDKLDVPTCDAELLGGYMKQFVSPTINIEMRETANNLSIKSENSQEKTNKTSECEIQMAQMSQNVPVLSENNSLFQLPQNEENDKENSLASGKLKKIGVVNADAFCDICCKEYCNKYFLRTHKLKSHGIIPVEDKKDDIVNGSSNMFWYQAQTTPLNLIVNETASSNREENEKLFFDNEGEEYVCNECGRYFQSQFLLKMHQAYSHPNILVRSDNNPPSKLNSKTPDATNTKDLCNKPVKQIPETYLPIVKSDYFKNSDTEVSKEKSKTDDLKKLQTLILRLNSSSSGERSMCDVCEKDVGHVSLLENHILKEHAILLEELGNMAEEDTSSSQTSQSVSLCHLKKECPHCQKIFYKTSLLEQHVIEVHSNNGCYTSNSEVIKESFESKDNSLKLSPVSFALQSSDDRQGLQTPTSSFCEICKKELCNKYFMKTHMQRMHGISIENGAQIGGVVCDICNKELCSKYFLRVHKQNSHGIVDELFLPQIGLDFGRNQSPNTDTALKLTDQSDLTHRYFTHFNEVCNLCNRRFRSIKWLKAHLWNDHGNEGKEKWKEVFLQYHPESKTNNLEGNSKDIGSSFEFPTIFGSTSNLLSQIASTVEDDLSGKDLGMSGGKPALNDKGSMNSTTTFSMLMNGKDSEVKHYQCSYCSFNTTILAFLFIHERSHMRSGYKFASEQPSQCPVCFQNITSKEHLEKHLEMHNIPWQQTYSLNNPNNKVLNLVENKYEMKNEPIICKTPDTVGVAHHDQDNVENMTSKPLHEVKTHISQDDQSDFSADSTLQCTRCRFFTSNVQTYLDHVNKEHPYLRMDQELPSYLQQMERALSTMACNAGIPAVFAVPQVQDTVTMQPFVLENSEYGSGLNSSVEAKPGKTFLSSLVFLPVKKKLKKPVTASFKLTPT